MLSDQTDAIRE